MNQKTQFSQINSVEQDHGLGLIELWKILAKYRNLVIVITAVITLGSIFYTLSLPVIYKAEVTMFPVADKEDGASGINKLANITGINIKGSSLNRASAQAIVRLNTRGFLIDYIQEKNLKFVLFSDQWNKAEKKWIDKEPSNHEAYEFLSDMIEITGPDPKDPSQLITLFLEWKDPNNLNIIADIANELISQINIYEKKRTLVESKKSLIFFERELKRTDLIDSKALLYSLIEGQIKKKMWANIGNDMVFKIIDPAITPIKPESNKTILIIILSTLFGVIFGSFAAISVNYIKENI